MTGFFRQRHPAGSEYQPRCRFLLYVILFLVSAGIVHSFPYEKNIDKFKLLGSQSDSAIVNYLHRTIRQNKDRFTTFFNQSLSVETTIIVAASEDHFIRLTGGGLPEWSAGVAYTRQGKIILKPADYFDKTSYRQRLLHEIAHIFLNDVTVPHIPVWFHEGLAEILAGKALSMTETYNLGTIMAAGKLHSLDQIDSLHTFTAAEAHQAYLESFLAVSYLRERYGEPALKRFINRLSEERTFAVTFEESFSDNLNVFEIEWYQSLKERFGWIILLQFENLLWVFLVVVIFIVFIIKKLSARRIVRGWEEAELNQTNGD